MNRVILFILLISLFVPQTLARMSERDQQDFIKEYVTWMKGPDVKFESLQIFNFGYERSLPLPSVALDSNSSSRLNLQTSGLQTPSKWSMVVIGKKCVRRFLELMTTIAQIHEDTQALPFAVFVESEDDIKIRNISSHVTPTLVHIPQRKSSKSFVFKMKCELNSNTTHDVMISKEIRAPNSFEDVCRGEPRTVNIGYNNDPLFMTVENNSLTSTPTQSFMKGKESWMSQTWEVFSLFFSHHNIKPNWLNCDFSWGWYDEELGGWTGCMGKIEKDEADIVTPHDYFCYHGRGTIATCAPGFAYYPNYWFSKFPSKISPTWNLLKLFDQPSWMMIFISIMSVTLFLYISARIGSLHFGIRTFNEEIALSPFRIPLLCNQQSSNSNYKILEFWKRIKIFSFSRVLRISFPLGFSSRMVFLLWCVCGGLLQHFLECNFLTILLKPNYEKFVDTAEDVLDMGLAIVKIPGGEAILEKTKKSSSSLTRELSAISTVTKDWDEYDKMMRDCVTGDGHCVAEAAYIRDYIFAMGRWHRSRDKKSRAYTPFASYIMNKKWMLEEEFNNHILRFQQAGLAMIEKKFPEVHEEKHLEKLRMEHFYFPLILWLGGLLMSAAAFFTEIIFKRRGNQTRT